MPRTSSSVSTVTGADAPAATDAEPPIGLHIDVVCEDGDWDADARSGDGVRAAAAALCSELHLNGAEACVALSDDVHVAALNGTYRGKPSPTNVLSFPGGGASASADAAAFLGDVVLAQETVAREAAELGLPFDHHLQHLVVHGLLHLLGYDHGTDAEAQTMEGLEVRILARLGIADPYAAAGEPLDPEPISKRARP
jgi:probable rRNA maturation factor